MNILFTAQNRILLLFYNLLQELRTKTEIDKAGFYIADSRYYDVFTRSYPDITSGEYELLKEWEVIKQSKDVTPDIDRLKEYESKYGDPVLWNAIVADRRIYFGKRMTLEQDYPSRFSHEEMLAILNTTLVEIEKLFDKIKPDIVVGFICVTIGEYLAYLVAKSRNIPYLNLRPTKIKNFFFASEQIFEPSKKIEATYRQMLTEGVPEEFRQKAHSILTEIRETHAMYEGVLPAGNFTSANTTHFIRETASLLRSLPRLTKKCYENNFGKYRFDNHYWGSFYMAWFKKFKRPARISYINHYLKRHYIHENRLSTLDYIFYPMHKEPEVSLLVFGRPYLNQIELIRNISRSLPVGMKLVLKEHPGAVGYRPLSFYKKLLAIPNVLLAFPGMTSRQLVENSIIVAVVSGSVALESIMLKRPVIHFGNIPFCVMPDNMILHAKEPDKLAWDIKYLIDNHKHDENALLVYMSAVMRNSVPIDFYSVLLARQGVYNPAANNKEKQVEYSEQMKRLSSYILDQVKDLQNHPSTKKEHHAPV